MSNQYHEQQDIKNKMKIRSYCEELPVYVDAYMRSISQRTSTTTQLGYVTDIRSFLVWLKSQNPALDNHSIKDISEDFLGRLTVHDFEDYLRDMDTYLRDNQRRLTQNETKRRRLAAIKGLFKYLYKMDFIETNVTTLVETPKLNSKRKGNLDADEVVSILDNAEKQLAPMSKHQKVYAERDATRNTAIITLLLGTGIRVSECVGINISDINTEKARIKVFRKEGKEEYVYYSDEVSEALEAYLEMRKGLIAKQGHEDALFLSDRMQRVTTQTVRNIVSTSAQNAVADKNVTPHMLRRTYGTNLYRETGDIYAVAECLGHKDITTTKEHYVDDSDDTKRRYRNAIHLK